MEEDARVSNVYLKIAFHGHVPHEAKRLINGLLLHESPPQIIPYDVDVDPREAWYEVDHSRIDDKSVLFVTPRMGSISREYTPPPRAPTPSSLQYTGKDSQGRPVFQKGNYTVVLKFGDSGGWIAAA